MALVTVTMTMKLAKRAARAAIRARRCEKATRARVAQALARGRSLAAQVYARVTTTMTRAVSRLRPEQRHACKPPPTSTEGSPDMRQRAHGSARVLARSYDARCASRPSFTLPLTPLPLTFGL